MRAGIAMHTSTHTITHITGGVNRGVNVRVQSHIEMRWHTEMQARVHMETCACARTHALTGAHSRARQVMHTDTHTTMRTAGGEKEGVNMGV